MQRMGLALQHLNRYHDEGHDMLARVITGDESWVHQAAKRILCCWFSGACETMVQVPQCTGRLRSEIKAFLKSVLLFV
jgi:hypothetical protein